MDSKTNKKRKNVTIVVIIACLVILLGLIGFAIYKIAGSNPEEKAKTNENKTVTENQVAANQVTEEQPQAQTDNKKKKSDVNPLYANADGSITSNELEAFSNQEITDKDIKYVSSSTEAAKPEGNYKGNEQPVKVFYNYELTSKNNNPTAIKKKLEDQSNSLAAELGRTPYIYEATISWTVPSLNNAKAVWHFTREGNVLSLNSFQNDPALN